jgi:hypothetical protein
MFIDLEANVVVEFYVYFKFQNLLHFFQFSNLLESKVPISGCWIHLILENYYALYKLINFRCFSFQPF